MTNVELFHYLLLLICGAGALTWLAERISIPPAVVLLLGGCVVAVAGKRVPDMDPALLLVAVLPPLLMSSGFYTAWKEFRQELASIASLALGAVVFTTVAVALAVHAVNPALPWAACFTLGAIVSPPDAVAAKAVLERVALPRRLMVLLEGESLLNDAAGLVLFRFAVAAALTGAFSLEHAVVRFAELGLGGVAIGFVVGKLVVWFLKQLDDDYLVITVAVITGWIAYIAGEMVEVSGVIATVTAGMIVGWHQHEVFSAAVRTRGTAFWQVIVFLLEAMVFVLIGLSLRGAIHRLGGFEQVLATMVPPMFAVLAAVIVSRFVWIYAVEALKWPVRGIARRGEAPDWKAATIMSWAGMRGVVTLAIALSLPEAMPGRDVILVASFAVILVTVLLQGTTIGPLIRLLRLPQREERAAHHLTEPQTWAYVEAAQLAAIQPLVRDENGVVIHPRLLEQYTYRAELTERAKDEPAYPAEVRTAHYDVVLAAIRAGRAELLRLHRSGRIHDEMLHALERDLDLQEVSAQHARG